MANENMVMKKVVLILVMVISYVAIFAQDGQDADTVPAYKKTMKIPSFNILELDSSTWFTEKQLPANKPTVIVYFSPDCGHCQMTAKEWVNDIDKVKDVELVWVSYHTISQIKDFADTYGLSHFNNVVFGRDVNYYFVPYYKIPSTPFMAVYDKKGKFLKAYEGGTNAETIAELIKESK